MIRAHKTVGGVRLVDRTEPRNPFSSSYYHAAMDDEGCLGVCKLSAICTGSEKRVGNEEISPATQKLYQSSSLNIPLAIT
jgi:hypothetical protein